MALVRDGRIIQMNRFNGTDYDIQYPKTHIKQITTNAEVPERVGEITRDGEAVFGALAETDYVISAEATTKGTSTLYTADIGNAYINYEDMDGVAIRLKFHTSTGNKPMLNVNGLGARPILSNNGSPILFEIAQGAWATLIYSNSLSGWIVQGWAKRKTLKTEIITATKTWKVPDGIEGGVNVRLFGGGGAGSTLGGGYGGHMNVKVLQLKANENIPITIGAGGTRDGSSTSVTGGTTSFGAYLSANGGQEFVFSHVLEPRGGTGGGASLYRDSTESDGGQLRRTGGSGSYGGGGGGSGGPFGTGGNGGNGGTYGGGGGAGGIRDGSGATKGSSGGSGGNGAYRGGNGNINSEGGACGGGGGGYSGQGYSVAYPAIRGANGGAGKNTTGMNLDFMGEGKGGQCIASYGGAGGGGYGGNGGNASGSHVAVLKETAGGGGGGYGGNGGNGYYGAGGGGGYGSKGGDGGNFVVGSYYDGLGGGGGGYGLNGKGGDGASVNNASYPLDYNKGENGGIAAGGGAGGNVNYKDYSGNGGDGVCILTYWLWE